MTGSRLLPPPVCLSVCLAVLLRVALLLHGRGSFDDPDNYLPLAKSLSNGQGFSFKGRPTAYRPPLYPLLLATVVGGPGHTATLGIALLHVALGGATVWLTAFAARGIGLSPARVSIAAFIVACDPVLVWQVRSVMTETPAAFLVAAALAGLTVTGATGVTLGGAAFGLAGLCRPSLLVPAALTILAAAICGPGERWHRAKRPLLLAVVIISVISPWMLRNLLVFGEPIWTTTHGGYTLALANNPVYYRDVLNGPPGSVWTGEDQFRWWDSINRDLAGMPEPEADRELSRRVWNLIQTEPLTFARAAVARLVHFWSVAPAQGVYSPVARWLTVAWTVPLWLALLAGCCRPSLWRWPAVASLAAIAGLTLVHAVYWTDLRMRAPIVPAIAIIAAGAIIPGIRRISCDREHA
jgi:hypothetical protein